MHIEVVIRKKSGDSNSSESASAVVEKKHKDHEHHRAAAPGLCEASSSITDISEASFANGVNNNHNVRLTDISDSSFADGVNDTHSVVIEDHHQKDPVTTPKNLSPQSSQRRQSMSDDENGDGNSNNNNNNMDGTRHNGMLECGGSSSELKKSTSENTDTDPSKIPTLDPTKNSNNEPGNMGSLKSMMEVIKEDKALDPSRLNIRKQSEILSKIPPFNLFIRNFEELTTSKTANMLLEIEARMLNNMENMEKRIGERQMQILDTLDGIDIRLNAIEQSLQQQRQEKASVDVNEKQNSASPADVAVCIE